MTDIALSGSDVLIEAFRLLVIGGLAALLGALVVTYVVRRERPMAMWYGGIAAAMLLAEDIVEHIERFVTNSWPTWHLIPSTLVIVFGFMSIHQRKEERT